MSTTDWRTLINPQLTAGFVPGELHVVVFAPCDDDGGIRSCVSVQIPEASRQRVAAAMQIARREKCRVLFLCDTREQADRVAARAGKLLPDHRRVAYERAQAGRFGGLT
ncbi:MAG: hypothetical protein JO122_17590 [Acetobacteraceae bacterium]|nr:hypothetical protein [Acetobacteraceae bacterium]